MTQHVYKVSIINYANTLYFKDDVNKSNFEWIAVSARNCCLCNELRDDMQTESSRTNVASVGSVFNDTRKVLSLPEPTVVREPLPFAYHRKF